MKFSLTTQIANTHLLSRRKQTAIAALGVTFGIAMFIAMTAFMTGVNKLLEDTMLSNSPHVHIFNDIKTDKKPLLTEVVPAGTQVMLHHPKPKPEKKNLRNAQAIAAQIAKDDRVQGVSSYINSQVFYNYGPVQLSGLICGVNIMDEDRLFNLAASMKQGKLEDLESVSNGILIGKGLAKKLNATRGDRISATTPGGGHIVLNIAGIFQTGIGQIDDVKSYADISTVQKILMVDKSYITDIQLKLKDLNQSTTVAREYAAKFGYKAEDWETANATVLFSFTIRNIITGAVVVTLLLVAGFGIYNIMNMTIHEKMKDIAILKATGFTAKDILMVFLTQALLIGVIGGCMGLVMGLLMSLGISRVPFDTGGILAVDHMPVNFDGTFYVIGIVFGIVTTFFAGFFPSRKAGKIDPVEIIRG